MKARLPNDDGQMVAELFVVLPVALVTLVVITNVFAFVAVSAKLDKAANNVVRQLYQIPQRYYGSSEAVLTRCINNRVPNRIYVSLSYMANPGEYLGMRQRVVATVMWTPFGSKRLKNRIPAMNNLFKRTKYVYIPSAEMEYVP